MTFTKSRCTCCAVAPSGLYAEVVAEALAHEQVFVGHQVQILDGPCTQLPRSMWTDKPAPVLAPVVEVAA